MTLRIDQLWRYPVKSLAGEALTDVEVSLDGITGDRLVQVYGPEGVRTSRRQHRMLGLHETLGPDGHARVDGHRWDTPEALRLVQAAAGTDAWLAADDSPDRFDVLPLLVATDGAIAAFGRDGRRLRPNLVIGGVDGLDERTWPGSELHIGELVIALDSLRPRCPMTTIDPDTLVRDSGVLLDIGRRFGGRLALNAKVLRPGRMRVGDAVELVRTA
ncbi:MAG: MOSC domain-containing protein [Chloroflexi bacterium]|nr:MOSC domain-containing protein [Chloroflexota bacterium]